jgi:nucleoside-diphosphate-sugar epimerase
MSSDVPEQRRLSDACLASHDQDSALTLAHLCQEAVQHFALAGPVQERGRKGGGHIAGKTSRPATLGGQTEAASIIIPPMRLLVTGGTGVLGRALRPLAEAAGHELAMPGREELDLFDPTAVADAVRDVDGVLHLATRIRSLEQISDPDAWRENDRLRADASRTLADAAIAAEAAVYVQPTVTFVYPPNRPVSEDTPVGEVLPILRSALAAEQQAERFAGEGGRGVVLRFGLLDGPGTWFTQPMGDFGATLHVRDAGRALLSALSLPSGIYNVCRDGERVSNERFTRAAGWHPQQ